MFVNIYIPVCVLNDCQIPKAYNIIHRLSMTSMILSLACVHERSEQKKVSLLLFILVMIVHIQIKYKILLSYIFGRKKQEDNLQKQLVTLYFFKIMSRDYLHMSKAIVWWFFFFF